MSTVHTKESVQHLLDTNNRAVVKALLAVYARQTASEQAGHHTREVNGVGFSKFDAPFLTDMVRSVHRYGSLTPKQMAVTRNKMKRYWRQLVDIANSRPQRTASADDAVEPRTVSADHGAYVPLQAHCTCENYDGERKCPRCERLVEKDEFARQERAQEERAFLSDPDLSRYPNTGAW
jgi:hypothetical protein